MFMVKAIQDAFQQSFFFLQRTASMFSAFYMYRVIISSLFLLPSLELLKIMVFLVLIVPVCTFQLSDVDLTVCPTFTDFF